MRYRVKVNINFNDRVEGNEMGKFQDLKVWQRAKDLAVYIYKLTNKTPFSKDFGL